MLEKTNTVNRTELVRFSMENGLIGDDVDWLNAFLLIRWQNLQPVRFCQIFRI